MKKKILKKIDKPLLIMSILYCIIGVFAVLSASSVSSVMRYSYSPYHYFIRQSIFYAVSFIIGFFFILRISTKNYTKYIKVVTIGILTLLLYVLIKGEFVNNARSWIQIGSFGLQPSEFAKTAIIIYFGVYFGDKYNKNDTKYGFLIPVVFAILVAFLVYLQPDLGTAIIIGFLSFLLFFSVPFKNNQITKILKILGGSVVVVVLTLLSSGALLKGNFLNDMQKERLTFKSPCSRYLEDTGYQVCNGFIAINNGGLFGKGPGNSTQKYLYLPEAHTDFIFPIIVEEIGLVGGIAIILGFMFILYRIFKIAKNASNLRNSIIAFGCGLYMLIHLIINFCGILALTPITGTPVPFLSYGGSFSINLIFTIFITLRISAENKIDKEKEEIKRI